MAYQQLTSDDRYMLSILRKQGLTQAAIARELGRSPSTISREIKRNRCAYDDFYRYSKAIYRTKARRSVSRRNGQFCDADYTKVQHYLAQDWSPDQISGYLKKRGLLKISHETIYQYIWRDKANGGLWYKHLRQSSKKRRKRYNSYDSRGRLAGKRNISERPAIVETRTTIGHWEIDTVVGRGSKNCIMTLVERKSGYVLIGKLKNRTMAELNRSLVDFIDAYGYSIKTITADNGTEFHGHKEVERMTNVPFYFANPYHSWERGTNENTNGLIRQYIPKRTSMEKLTQAQCNAIADKLNSRPRKRLNYEMPEDIFNGF